VIVVETGEIRKRVLAGEAYDVIMVPREAADAFEQASKIVPGSAVQLIRVNFGLAVPADGPRPDVSTPEALKNTFLRARTVLITDPATGGISGVHLMDVLGKLGIADEMKSRLVPRPGGGFHAERVVKGEADLAVQAEHEIRCVKGATFLPYPAVFQRTIVFMGGVGSAAGDAAAAKAYLHYVTGADTANTYSAHCLTRG
jgi:molybdate transport system substrate-binding protein